MGSPQFDPAFLEDFERLLAWRRDVRRFRAEPVPAELLTRLLDLACLAPSVGNSQPWRFVRVDDASRRAAIRASFAACNRDALAAQPTARAAIYAQLKLEGLDRAPIQLAVFCDEAVRQGHGLGSRTMRETLAYSVVTAVHTLWLGARAHGLGVGWVSIVDPHEVHAALDVAASWRLVAYLCLGWPVEEHDDPELERHGWQARTASASGVLQR